MRWFAAACLVVSLCGTSGGRIAMGAAPIKLNGPLVAGGNVSFNGLQFSPDSSRVLYHADQTTNELFEIFSVSSSGGVATKLNGALVAGGDVVFNGLAFSPDSSRVLYLADQTTDAVTELFSVPSAGGIATKLNGALVAGGVVSNGHYKFSPDSSRVLYRADQTTDIVDEIFSVPSAGGMATKLNGALVASGDVLQNGLQFSPDSSRVFYLADQTTDTVNEIFSVPSAGGVATKLNGALVAGGDVVTNGFKISPNSSRVIYLADQTTDEVVEIFSVPSAGGTATKLNGALVAGGDVSLGGFQFSPDSSRVLYLADQTTNDVFELFSVPSAGGVPTKLNGALVAGGDVSGGGLAFSPDSCRVLYIADQTTDEVDEIFIVPSAGGTAVKVNGPLVAGGSVLSSSAMFSPDGSRVLYLADQDTDNVNEIYVRVIEAEWNTGSGNWATNANWKNGFAPDEVMQTVIDQPATVALTGTGRQAFSLDIGGGSGTSILELQAGAGLTVSNGITVNEGGVIRGDGTIEADVFVNQGGEIRAAAGDQLRIAGSLGLSNSRLEAVGSAGLAAEIEVDGPVAGEGSVLIVAQNATMRFNSGLYNEGAFAVSTGTTSIFGDVDNQGSIVVSGGAAATFYDDVNQGADLQVSKVGSTTSVAVFFGSFTGGGGTGGGDIFFEGDLQPGQSPAHVTFENDVFFGSAAVLQIELAGTTPGSEHDRVDVDGALELAGTLDVSLINGFNPMAGNSFDILDWTTLSGTFDTLSLPALGAGLAWDTSQLYSTGVLSVAAGLVGDYNNDGTVDAADYVVWRKHNNTATTLPNDSTPGTDDSDFGVWQEHFGQSLGSGASTDLNVAVPEPATIAMLIFGWLVMGLRKVRRAD